MLPDDVGRGLASVDRVLERLEDVLPADDDQRIHVVLEEAAIASRSDSVAFVLESLDLDEMPLRVAEAA